MKRSQLNSALISSKAFHLVLIISIVLGLNCDSSTIPVPARIKTSAAPTVTQSSPPTVLIKSFNMNLVALDKPESSEPTATNSDLAQTIVQILGISFQNNPDDTSETATEYDIITATTGIIIDAKERLILTDFRPVDWQNIAGERRIDTLYIVTNRDPRKPQIEYQAELIAANFERDLAILKLTKKIDGSAIESYAPFSEAKIAATVPRDSGQELRILGHTGIALEPIEIEKLQLIGLMNSSLESIKLLLEDDLGSADKFPEYLKLMGGPNLIEKGAAFTSKGTFAGFLSAMPTERDGPKVMIRSVDSITDAFASNNVVPVLNESYRREFTYRPSNQARDKDQIYVSSPHFATLALTNKFGRELAQYGDQFNNISEIFYEYLVSKTRNQIELSEIWLFDNVVIEALSQSRIYSSDGASWHGQSLRAVTANTAMGLTNDDDSNALPKGNWELQILINGTLVATSQFTVGSTVTETSQTSPPVSNRSELKLEPEITNFVWGTSSNIDGEVTGNIEAGIEKILLGFNYQHFDESMIFGWKVYYGPDLIYSSQEIPWVFEEYDRFWIGFHPTEPLWPGWWEFELYLNGEIISQIGRTVGTN